MAALFAAINFLDATQLILPGPLEAQLLPTLVLMIGIIVAGIAQYIANRGDPAARAALRWFAASVVVCAGTFVLMVTVPPLVNSDRPLSQGYGFVLFAMLFVGVAAGVARFRLFDLDRWAFIIFFYLGALLLLLALDAGLIYLVSVERPSAFAASLLLVVLLYLPVRDWLMRRMLKRSQIDRDALFAKVLDVALAAPEQQAAGWHAILAEAFRPLHIGVSQKPCDVSAKPRIVEDGIAMLLPPVGKLEPLRLAYARGGRGLFDTEDLRVAETLSTLLAHALESRDAHDAGAESERLRIAADMHDNLGAQLLAALHSRTEDRKDTLIRATISDLRDIVNNASRSGRMLGDLLVDLKVEAQERLEASDILLDWKQQCDDEGLVLEPGEVHSLRSVLRELVSNTIRHSGARRVEISLTVQNGQAELAFHDDGSGIVSDRVPLGNGLANVEARILSLNGTVDLAARASGFALRTSFVLEGEQRP